MLDACSPAKEMRVGDQDNLAEKHGKELERDH